MAPLATIAAVVSATAALGTMAYTLFNGGSSFNMPQLTQFQLPQQTMNQLNAQISNDATLSTQAQQAAQSAIQQYSSGQLSAAYQGQYQAQYDSQLNAVTNQLAAQGYDKNSTQYQNAMAQFQEWAGSLKSTFLQNQLNAALSENGVSSQAISNINSIISEEAGITNQNNQNLLSTAGLQTQQSAVNTANAGNIGNAVGNIASVLGGGTKTANGVSSTIPGIASLFSNTGTSGITGMTPQNIGQVLQSNPGNAYSGVGNDVLNNNQLTSPISEY